MADMKVTFIHRCVVEYFERVMSDIKAGAIKEKVGVTNEAIKSLSYQAAINGAAVSGSLSFKEYLRMVDMGAGRGHPIGGLRKMTVELQSRNYIGAKLVKDNVRKPKKIYSKSAYGNLTYMYNKMLYGYSEEVIRQMHEELDQANKTQSN